VKNARRRIACGLAAVGLVAAGPVGAGGGATAAATPIVQKSCSGGFRHAVINGSQKCLRRGEFCAHAADRQYRRYGFRCTRRDARGNYHLT
jgi:hypothetical protein